MSQIIHIGTLNIINTYLVSFVFLFDGTKLRIGNICHCRYITDVITSITYISLTYKLDRGVVP